jgi:arylsulfatase A-like enzyme
MFRPHLEWYAPRKYFDMYPLSEIQLPRVKDDDLDDLPPIARKWAADRGSNHAWIRQAGEWPKLVRAYLACISYSDAQVGRILDALEAGPNANSTVVVLWSDHGYHLGEKEHWHKFVLWERSTRVPLIVRVPGMTKPGSRCGRPVSLVDLYRTLIDLCGLPDKPGLDGRNIVPLLKDPAEKWSYPVVCIQEPGNCAVRSECWRYIRYRDGGEELYDHETDPNEWKNLAASKEHKQIKQELAGWIPKRWAESAPTKSEFRFDPHSFTWIHKKTGKRTYGGKR